MGELRVMVAESVLGRVAETIHDVFPPGTKIESGDTRVMWNPDNADETAAAKHTWDSLVGGKRFLGYRVNPEDASKGEQIREFDPAAGKLIISAPMAGG